MQRGASKKTTGDHCFSRRVQLLFGEAAFARAVAEDHVLQFALAALVADRAIERMIGEQEFEHVLARLVHLRRSRCAPPCLRPPTSVHAVCSFGIFSTSTRHMRQAACSDRPS